MLVLTKILLFLLAFIKVNESSNILLVNSIKSFSHVAPMVQLAEALTKREHNVTLIYTYQVNDKIQSFRKIWVNFHTFIDRAESDSKPQFETFRSSIMTYIKRFFEFGKNSSDSLLTDAKVKDLLANPDENFDIVIIEQFATIATLGFCHHFKASCINYTPIRMSTILNPLIGYIPPLPYVRESFYGSNINLSFFENFQNLAFHLYAQFLLYYSYLPEHDALLKRHFKNAPAIQDLMFNVSLVLQNSHPSINSPAPEPSYVIEIGGFHIKQDDAGPEEIKNFLDSSKQDVVFFSMGSVLKSNQIPDVKINVLLRAFSKLNNVTILWKYENNNLKEKPDNVKIISWAPQKYILAHPKVKLFISHGGIFSIMEAVYFAKPVMGIPVFGDQLSNMMYLESIGVGKYIDIDHITEEVVITCVKDILSNASFSLNAKENSKLFRDQHMHPMDKAIYWIENVQRHTGVLRPALKSLHFSMYELLFLDIIIFILSIISVILLLSIKCIKHVKYGLMPKCNKTFKNKVKATTKQKKDF